MYKVIRERIDGTQGKRAKKYYSFEPDLRVGGLYAHLGPGFPGLQRILSMSEEELPEGGEADVREAEADS